MILLFFASLFLTFIILRICIHIFDHPGEDKSDVNTPTKILSRKLGINVNHIHIGIMFLVILFPIILMRGFTNFNIILLGINTSFILDHLPFFTFIKKEIYFNPKGIFISLLSHTIFAIILFVIYFKV
jgi:hypothetical protein